MEHDIWGWRIDRDYISDQTEKPLVGHAHGASIKGKSNTIRFRILDDDRNVYVGGSLIDDDYADSQADVLNFMENYAGATIVEVKRANKWVIEID